MDTWVIGPLKQDFHGTSELAIEPFYRVRAVQLGPVFLQSGKWKGHAHIQGDRAGLRKCLCMPALVATRYNAPFKKNTRS